MAKIRVLLADDHLLAREGLCRILEKEQDLECVAIAENGKQAVKLARENLPDVAIIDVAMPDMNGIEATKQIKAACSKTTVLIVSAYKYDHYVLTCIEAGADGYLLKDKMLAHRLVDAVRMVHGGESVFDHEAREVMRKLASSKNKQRVGSGQLSNRELQILKLVIKGMSNKRIASELSITEPTVGRHLVNIFSKLQVRSRVEATLYALKKGWVSIDDVD